MEEQHQILHNAIFNALGRFFSIALSFFFMPYIVHKLGTESYGIYVLIFAVVGYFALLDFDLGQAIIKYVSEYRAVGDIEGVNRVIGATLSLYLSVGIVGGCVVFFCSDMITSRLLKIPEPLLPVARFTFRVASVGLVFTMLLSAFSSIPKALNRYDISSKLTISVSLLTTLGTVFLLYKGYGLRAIVVLDITITFLSVVFYMLISKHLLPEIRYRPHIDAIALKTVLPFGLYSSLGRISYILQFQLDRILTGTLLGASFVTYYFVPFNLVSKVMTLTSQLSGVIMPVVSGLQGKKAFESLIAVYLQSSRLIVAIASSVCLPLILFGDRLLCLWMGKAFTQESGRVLMLITIALYADALTNVPSFVVQGLGRPKVTGGFALANAIINVGLLFPLAKIMGLNGIAMAFFISTALIVPLFIWYANKKVLHFSLWRLFKESYARPLTAAVLVGVPLSFFPAISVDNIFVLLGMMGAVSLFYLLMCVWTGAFTREELRQFMNYIRYLLRRL